MKFLRRATASMLTVLILLLSSWWFAMQGYQQLTEETLIAELQFEKLGENRYLAKLYLPHHCGAIDYPISGNQWRLDVEFTKVKYWATLIGIDSLYRLDRLQGRFRSIKDENQYESAAYDLHAVDTTLEVTRGYARKIFNVMYDTDYGSSNYAEIDIDKRYLVYKTPTGLLTRREPVDDALVSAVGVTITIDKSCADRPAFWKQWFE